MQMPDRTSNNIMSEQKTNAAVKTTTEGEDKDSLISNLKMEVEALTSANEELSLQLAAAEKAKGAGKSIVKIGKKSYVAKYPTVRIKGEVFKVEELKEEQLKELLALNTFFEQE